MAGHARPPVPVHEADRAPGPRQGLACQGPGCVGIFLFYFLVVFFVRKKYICKKSISVFFSSNFICFDYFYTLAKDWHAKDLAVWVTLAELISYNFIYF